MNKHILLSICVLIGLFPVYHSALAFDASDYNLDAHTIVTYTYSTDTETAKRSVALDWWINVNKKKYNTALADDLWLMDNKVFLVTLRDGKIFYEKIFHHEFVDMERRDIRKMKEAMPELFKIMSSGEYSSMIVVYYPVIQMVDIHAGIWNGDCLSCVSVDYAQKLLNSIRSAVNDK